MPEGDVDPGQDDLVRLLGALAEPGEHLTGGGVLAVAEEEVVFGKVVVVGRHGEAGLIAVTSGKSMGRR